MALEWKDKVDGEDWVLAEDINAIAKAVRDVENGKLDIFTVQGKAGDKVYVAKANGTQSTAFIGDRPYQITRYLDSGVGNTQPLGYLVAHDPEKPYQVATKNYADKLDSVLNGRTTDLERRMKNVEAAALGNTYLTEEDSSAAYRKIVPLAALPYAGIERLGGAVKGGGGSVTLFESPFAIYNDDEGILTVEGGAGGEYTFSGAIQNGAQVTLYDANFPEPIEAGEYEFFFEGDGTAWSIWNANITVYNAPYGVTLYENSVSATNDARMSFTLEEDGIYVLYFSVIPAVGEIGTLTVRPKLVKKGDPIEKSPVTAIKVAGAQLFDETQITEAANFKGDIDEKYGVVENGYLKAMYSVYGGTVLWAPFSMHLEAGSYTVTADVFVGSASPTLSVVTGISIGEGITGLYTRAKTLERYDEWQRVTNAFNNVEEGDYFFAGCGGGNSEHYENLDVRFKNIKIERGTTATDFVPYQEPVTAYTVSQAIQDIDGYGLGISDSLHNYIDFENQTFVRMVAERAYQEGDISNETMLTDGVTTLYALATPEIVDISDLLTFDGVVEVEGGGEIIADNALALAIPSTVLYQVKI